MPEYLIKVAYLAAAVLFILGLKGLTHPRTAVRGNLMSALAMLLAVVVTLLDRQIVSFGAILAGLALGAALGAFLALRIEMTSMPQLVAALNGLGGVASSLVAGAALLEVVSSSGTSSAGGFLSALKSAVTASDIGVTPEFLVATAASGLIGSLTLSGSFIAFGKLQGIVTEKSVLFPGQQVINGLLAVGCLVLAALLVANPSVPILYLGLCLLALILGVGVVMPIGGADMPVVIALLNSYSGLAAAATGFVLSNNVLIIAGSLVGASGLILTRIMCVAMNRSMTNVLFGVMQAAEEGETTSADEVYAGKVKQTSAEEIAMLLDGVRRVVVIPGYGMAVAQAQHAVRNLSNLLESRGVTVEFAIHPVAGRMPGHMNVLLAEADVPYDKLKEMDDINPTFETVDMAIVIGANDVVNPVARTDPNSPIAGMPILDVDKAKTVVVIKRSLSPGFAGIPNPLFAADNVLMYFADGKKAVHDLIAALKEVA